MQPNGMIVRSPKLNMGRIIIIVLFNAVLTGTGAMRLTRPWTNKPWCQSVVEPEWPMAYQKYSKQSIENKGRVNSNKQDMRRECATYGGEAKCHVCELIQDTTINYQLQGVQWEQMAHNIPTVTDSPFAVGGSHRFDFGNSETTHVCVVMTGKSCMLPSLNSTFFPPPPPSHPIPNANRPSDSPGIDLSGCDVRCWGYGWNGSFATPQNHLEAQHYIWGADNTDSPQFLLESLNHSYRLQDEDTSVPTDVWSYPKYRDEGAVGAAQNIGVFGYPKSAYGSPQSGATTLTFNPQGFTFTLAGSGDFGFLNGPSEIARFRGPQDVAVDFSRNVYVADTGNNCIRRVSPLGEVTTVAGKCGATNHGYHDGLGSEALFSHPSGVTVYVDWNSVGPKGDSWGQVVLFIADTDNHRIRRIDCVDGSEKNAHGQACEPTVSCWAGSCGNGTFSFTATHYSSPPQPGLADGHGRVARFDSPRGLEAGSDGTIYVADTNNHVIRVVNASQFVFTLAGHVVPQELSVDGGQLSGCPPPCIKGVPGDRDGNLTSAEFFFPKDVTLGYSQEANATHEHTTMSGGVGGNWSILVTDAQRVRRITFPSAYAHIFWGKQSRFHAHDNNETTTLGFSKLNGIKSSGRVFTVAGGRGEGNKDGKGFEASFNDPDGIAMDSSGHIFVVDVGTCHLRKITYANQVAHPIGCTTLATEIIRPSGCSSYDPPVDKRDLTVSASFGNIYYNYGQRDETDSLDGTEPRGRSIKDCSGSPPPDKLDKHFWNIQGDNLVIDDLRVDVKEDTGDSTTIKVRCPVTCAADLGLAPTAGTEDFSSSSFPTIVASLTLRGSLKYSDDSSVCLAALHAGALLHHEEGMVIVTLERGILDRNSSYSSGSTRHGVTSLDLDTSDGINANGGSGRLFSVAPYPKSTAEVQTIAGHPGALLEDSCGMADGQPPQEAKFNLAQGAAVFVNATLSATEFLYIADTANNRIRALSAICSQICENGGKCTTSDICECPAGWTGYDCTKPVCDSPCGLNKLCLSPNKCGCVPGFAGPECLQPICVQKCVHGTCAAPDTCACDYGWWDINCSTPVCSQTCGNGGNCTGSDMCSCPSDWQGVDCRVPVCPSSCFNGGSCVAPNTCLCPPQWTGIDCSLPVCTQGFFVPDPSPYLNSRSTVSPSFYLAYSPCARERWCNATNGFDCGQSLRPSHTVEPKWGAAYRNMSGRSTQPARCMRIEVGEDIFSHFQYINASRANETQEYGFLSTDSKYSKHRAYLDDYIFTRYARYTPKLPFTWQGPNIMAEGGDRHGGENYKGGDGSFTWSQKPARKQHTLPWYFLVDRQVAAVELRNFTTGVYVCANGGNCSSPDTCRCAPGWIGFDCRTPVCDQGYYVSDQERFVSGSLLENEIQDFSRFMEPELKKKRLTYGYLSSTTSSFYGTNQNPNMLGAHPMWEYSNPNHTKVWEYFVNKSHRVVETRVHGNERYLGPLGAENGMPKEKYQGGYQCSIRSFTEWEQSGAPHGNGHIEDHPNYWSRFMNQKIEDDGIAYTHWNNMEWPSVHMKTAPLQMKEEFWMGPAAGSRNRTNITYVYTNEGFRLDGIWRQYGLSRRGSGEAWGQVSNAFGIPKANSGDRVWEKGNCVVEFKRTCERGPPSLDLHSGLDNVSVQDTDLSYRPRLSYSSDSEIGHGRWDVRDRGECIDYVNRGCFNNGTCIAPNTCSCASGWRGNDCSVPVCAQSCLHNGNCTLPNICTCEMGWEGFDCSIPICAQQCLNGGICVAPDTCQCEQTPMQWYNHERVPAPLFQKPNGDPYLTGYTGFDCSVPICSQHAEFVYNVAAFAKSRTYEWTHLKPSAVTEGYEEFGGHSFNNLMTCDSVRCPQFDEMVTSNIGESFEGGCGFDPNFGQLDSWGNSDSGGCCILNDEGTYNCRACNCNSKNVEDCASILIENSNNFTCDLYGSLLSTTADSCRALSPYCQVHACDLQSKGAEGCSTMPSTFFINDDHDGSIKIRMCGPTLYQVTYDSEVVYRPNVIDYSRANNMRLKTSGSFLCSLTEWTEGDYMDDALLNTQGAQQLAGLGLQYGAEGPVELFPHGRHIRMNYNNVTRSADGVLVYGLSKGGEGTFVCHNKGSCVAPDVCTCTDGYAGFDCALPLCRHLRPDGFYGLKNIGETSACANGGVCRHKDDCHCITAPSILWHVHPETALRGVTGWTGTDCSLPICTQGYYDPFCTDILQAPGGEGCYRCSNGGNCTAPDVCVCAEGWTGYDCRIPVCEAVAGPLTRWQLNTYSEEHIHTFETDPCSQYSPSGYEKENILGQDIDVRLSPRGECVLPNECLCLCERRFNPNKCDYINGKQNEGVSPFSYLGVCSGPWQDPLYTARNVLQVYEVFGTRDCWRGYEGHVDDMDKWYTCHLTIKRPTSIEFLSEKLIIIAVVVSLVGTAIYYYVRRKIRQRYLDAKLARRQARRAVDDLEDEDDEKITSAFKGGKKDDSKNSKAQKK